MKIRKKRIYLSSVFIHTFFIIVSLLCFIPFLLVISASFSSEADLYKFGYQLIPKHINISGYQYIFKNPAQVLSAYNISILTTIVGTVLGLVIMGMIGYALSRDAFKQRRLIIFYLFFTMLFNGGLTPTYILITQYLHLKNNIWVLILPNIVNVFHIIILRTFFQKLPSAIVESAKIDGANEFTIFFKLIVPLSLPVIATVAFLGAIAKWNDWFTAMLYITKENLLPLQYLLQRIMMDIQVMTRELRNIPMGMDIKIPEEAARMAMLVLAAGPMTVVFPFFQKYFVNGLTVGSIKE